MARQLLEHHRPRTLVLCAGATPFMAPLSEQTWDTFSRAWTADVQQAFHWTQAALCLPLERGSRVLSFSSGAALRGSPLSGGYAGAKATVRFVAQYAAQESAREGLEISFSSVLPGLNPATSLGLAGATGYALREGVDVAVFLARLAAPSLEGAALDVVDLLTQSREGAFVLLPQGGVEAII